MNLKKEYTGLKYVSLIDSLSNNYILLPEVLRKKISKNGMAENWLIFEAHCTVMSFMYRLEWV